MQHDATPYTRSRASAAPLVVRIVHLQRLRQRDRVHHARCDIQIGPVVIRGVLASPAGVVWPTAYGSADPVVAFLDTTLQGRLEQHLRQASREG